MFITQGLKRAALINGDGLATVDGQRRNTWLQFEHRVARLAGALQAIGLEADGRVAILAFNSDRYLEYFYAVLWAGGIIVPLNIRLAPSELVYMVEDAGAQILIVDDAHLAMIPHLTASATIRHVIFVGEGDSPNNLLHHEAILETADPVPDSGRGGDDVAGIFYTGGTTGLPKGVMLTHTNLVSNALVSLLTMYEGEPWTYLHSAPMFHIADCQWNVGVTLHGGTHAFIPKFTPERMLKAIETYRVTHSALVPTMVNMLCSFDERENYDVSSLRGLNYGGSAMAPALIVKARQAFPRCRLFQGYGQTETSPNVSMLPDKYHDPDGPLADKISSAGQPVFTVEVKIVDLTDEEVPQGDIGEVVVRGPNVMAGYWNQPDVTAQVLRGNWLHTGDLGYLDRDGFLYIVDRLKDAIISGGENIYSTEVEQVIYQHPAVAMCAVIGIPDDKWGEVVHAIVVVLQGQTISDEDIISYCRQHIASYKCPRSVEIRTEPLPMSGAGKILKRNLRVPFWKGKTRLIN
ncbi:MAG: long-chain-fatty-acid--CoA ligase [Chloroflexota bacterium]